MPKLIYFVNHGSRYADVLNLCLNSLKPHIDDKYRVLICSDMNGVFPYRKIRFLTKEKRDPDLNRIDVMTGEPPADFTYYFDSDILFHRSIDLLKTDLEKIILTRASSTLMSSHYIQLPESALENVKGERAINNGSYIVPRSLYTWFYENWRKQRQWYQDNNPNVSATQSGLNKLYAENRELFEFIDDSHVYFPSDPTAVNKGTQVFTHFAGQSFEDRIRNMSVNYSESISNREKNANFPE